MIAFINEKETNDGISSIEEKTLSQLIVKLSNYLKISEMDIINEIGKIKSSSLDLEFDNKVILIRKLDPKTNEYFLV